MMTQSPPSRRRKSKTTSASSSSGRRQQQQSTDNRVILVTAPADLEEGYTFDVMVGTRRTTVHVPPGGVRQHEQFEIPYVMSDDDDDDENNHHQHHHHHYQKHADKDDDDDDDRAATLPVVSSSRTSSGSLEVDAARDNGGGSSSSSSGGSGATTPHHGHWRQGLLSCGDVICQATFWMACCCAPVLVAQLVTRLQLDEYGRPIMVAATTNNKAAAAPQIAALAYNKIVLSFVAVLLIGNVSFFAGPALVFCYIVVLLLVVGTNVRRSMRTRYHIPAQCPLPTCKKNNANGTTPTTVVALDDIAALCCCPCCALMQMARHTHNDREYPGYCCSTHGLEYGAPAL